MSERIETEYQGRAIHYAENQDVWKCESMDLEAKTLTALKNKMGKIIADARRMVAVPVLIMVNSYNNEIAEGEVTLLAEKGASAWVMVQDGTEWWKGKQRPVVKRKKFPVSSLLEPTAENRAAIEAARLKAVEAAELGRQAKAMRDAIPRFTLEMLKALVEEEGDD